MNYTCRCENWLSKDYGFGCTCHTATRNTKTSKPKNSKSTQLTTAKLALKGASGKLRHVTPKLIRQPSLIARVYAKLNTKFLFSVMGVAAVTSWFFG